MANEKKKTTASQSTKKSASELKKNTSKAPERDEYAYYDDLYEKKPRKKKKAEEEEERDRYAYYDDLYEKKSKKKPRRPEPEDEEPEEELPPASTSVLHRLMPYILGVVTLFIVACFLLARIDGAMGDLGLFLRNVFFGFFGWPAYFIPLVLINLIIYWRRYVDLGVIRRKIIFGSSIPILLSSLIHSLAVAAIYTERYRWGDWGKSIFGFGKDVLSNWTYGVELRGGGFFGGLFGGFLRCLVGYVGSVIVIIAVLALSIIFYVGLSPRHFIDMVSSLVEKIRNKIAERKAAKAEELDNEDDEDDVDLEEYQPRATRSRSKKLPEDDSSSLLAESIPEPEKDDHSPAVVGVEIKPANEKDYDPDKMEVLGSIETKHATKEKKKTVDPLRPISEAESPETFVGMVDTIFNEAPKTPAEPIPTVLEITEAPVVSIPAEEPAPAEPEDDGILLPENAKKKQAYEQLAAYIFPPLSLLRESTSPGRDAINAELRANAETLIEKLESFNVKLAKIEYSRGPTLTRYELYPAPGVKANSIKNLQTDIAMALQTKIRIEAPIPGKSAVGVEVPNKSSSTVAIRELLESDQFKDAKSKLFACLGKDITGEPIFIDVGKMPHLLIAGTTGSGKSVCINSIIISLLYKARPDEVQFIMIDPKKVEMSMYNNLPHLRVPVVTNVKKAAGTLNAAVGEMERRYELFENNLARDIDGYNRMMKAEDPDFIPLPRLVIIIDELADLMMSAPSEIETSIVRLAQKARAAGIHLIVGTQRPSVDVITGLIKANIPSRIAFAVASGIDSRTIIDTVGAEKLLGRGDMLFCPIGAQNPIRAQGTFVTDDEVVAVTNFVKENSAGAQYDDEFLKSIEKESEQIVTITPGAKKPTGGMGGGAASGSSECFDELFFDALKLAVESGTVATSFLQRNINVGFGRGARIIDRMAKLGFVTPPDGTKPRQVLLTSPQLAELIARDDKRIYGLIPQDDPEE
ncbi:MAG: DNA translocase FtsK 4TM domain-containing protein [Clostridia bacterium]|nr:DNA translocase FtsK 4TM domain-containing protein [Clostridia bacterium]